MSEINQEIKALRAKVKPVQEGTKVKTGVVRFAYAHVFEPYAFDDSRTPDYNVCLLIDKKDKETIAAIEAGIEAAKVADAKLWGGKVPKKFKEPLRDGDIEKEDKAEFAGMYFLNARSKRQPAVVSKFKDKLGKLIALDDEDDFYSGCYGRASVGFFGFSNAGNNGIAVGINNLQKLADGDRFAGGSNPEADFNDIEDDDDDLY